MSEQEYKKIIASTTRMNHDLLLKTDAKAAGYLMTVLLGMNKWDPNDARAKSIMSLHLADHHGVHQAVKEALGF